MHKLLVMSIRIGRWIETHISLHEHDDGRDERLNALTHYFGAVLALVALVFVLANLYRSKNGAFKAGLVIFAFSNLLLYSASGAYHSLPKGNLKRLARVLDHSNIYFLIAGTYTPILLYIGNRQAIVLTFLMWLLALAGIVFTVSFWGRYGFLHVLLYLLMGWSVVFFRQDVLSFVPKELFFYLLAGGLSYSIGVIFYAIKKIPHYHAIWHVFVLLGSIFFYVGILKCLLF